MAYLDNKLLIFLTGLFILVLLANSAGAVIRVVPTDYTNITTAYNAASTGDIIQIESGLYYERITISKRITLQGVNTGSGKPIIDGNGGGNVIYLASNGCTVDGLVIRNAGAYRIGIEVESDGNTISNNEIEGNNVGINVFDSNDNILKNNVISHNTDGIQMHTGSSNNEISGNTVTYNNRAGIMLGYSAQNNIISNNDASHNGQTTLGDGVSVYLCNGCTISGNTASGNSQSGIYIFDGNNDNATGNTASGNTRSGISLVSASACTVSGNTITGNAYRGFEITSSNGNTFFTNILSNSVNVGTDS
ncbi:MAG TPA: NosD domain-containing protein, partial [Methanothrix sp.]|nr:NosD domain-containing protein [Methanothrix sp.]